ncbi:hypothetical protein F5I97DRAFT_1969248 [Phlebopus sp. FC_14]|nr:hypothetical protein F5I97DRAFT_1969248 [Phlebopus sp. FC_14]
MADTVQKRKDAPSPDRTPDHSGHGDTYARKRLRTEDTDTDLSGGDKTLEKHATFWYTDADTVIAVENVLYRLSSSRLKDQSEVFRGLLSDEIDATAYEQVTLSDVDGETCYCVQDLAAGDFDVLLSMDRRPTDFCLKVPSFQEVAAILRAASVLKMDGYRAFAISYLENWWPSELCRVSENPRPYAVETFLLGQQCHAPQLLKPVLYELIRDPRWQREPDDGQEPDEENELENAWVHVEPEERGLESLSREDERLVHRARELVLLAWFETTSCNPSRSCVRRASDSKEQCPSTPKKRSMWEAIVHMSGLFRKYLYDPIRGFDALIAVEWEDQWCQDCVEQMHALWTKKKEELWDQLDELLSVDRSKLDTVVEC